MNDIDRRRRKFVREHHPDLGGDPETFIAGMRAFEAEPAPCTPAARIVVIKRERWLARLVTAAGRRLRRGRTPPRVR